MDGPLFYIDVHFSNQFTISLINQGYSYYIIVNPATIQCHKLPTLLIPPRIITGIFQGKPRMITQVAYGPLDVSGH